MAFLSCFLFLCFQYCPPIQYPRYTKQNNTGNSFKKSSPIDAVTSYQSAVTYLVDAGRLTQAAKLCKEIAELYETEQMEDEKSFVVHAIESYEQASELFQLEDSKSQSNHCQAKIAELCSAVLDPPDLTRAAHLYKDLGENSLSSNLLKFNAKSHFLNSILCHLAAGDAVAAESDLQQYESLDYTFGESREGKFATNLVESVVNTDVESFSNLCFEYDRISKLDPWKTSMLVKVKRSMEDGEDEDDVDLT